MKNKLLRIIKYYGIRKQLKYFQTEIYELSEAIIEHENRKDEFLSKLARTVRSVGSMFSGKKEPKEPSVEHITEEIADVLVMLEQFRQFYDIQMVDVQKIFKEKVERQNQRIDDEINKELSGEEGKPNE